MQIEELFDLPSSVLTTSSKTVHDESLQGERFQENVIEMYFIATA